MLKSNGKNCKKVFKRSKIFFNGKRVEYIQCCVVEKVKTKKCSAAEIKDNF